MHRNPGIQARYKEYKAAVLKSHPSLCLSSFVDSSSNIRSRLPLIASFIANHEVRLHDPAFAKEHLYPFDPLAPSSHRYPEADDTYRDMMVRNHAALAPRIVSPFNGPEDISIKLFQSDCPPEAYRIYDNGWPYSIEHNIRHCCIWTKYPFVPPRSPHMASDEPDFWDINGLVGFTGPDSESKELAVDPKVIVAATEVKTFIKVMWPESIWETMFLVNPR